MEYQINGYGCIPPEKLKACTEFYSVDQPIAPAYKIQIGDRFHFDESIPNGVSVHQAEKYLKLKHIPDSYYNYEVIGYK